MNPFPIIFILNETSHMFINIIENTLREPHGLHAIIRDSLKNRLRKNDTTKLI